jgi:beta-mannosidase
VLGRDGDDWFVDLRTDQLAQSVHIDLEGHRAEDDWFHLAPGATRRVKLHALSSAESDIPPAGEIRSLGSSHRVALQG